VAAVQLFYTCLVNEFAPDIGFAAVRVLERLGHEVRVPDGLTCCGQPAFNAGFHDEARAAVRHTIARLEASDGPIVIPSGSCGDMLTHQSPALVADDEAWRVRAERVAARCQEFSAFVAAPAGAPHPAGSIAWTGPRHLPHVLFYHPSCHLSRGLGVDEAPRALLRAAGATLVEETSEPDCCGFGGLFAIKHGGISSRMLDKRLAQVTASGADRLVSCDLGCLLHLGGGLHRQGSPIKVQHLAEFLDERAT
jgi:L-lactate dehydrogenase complex protein LldE